MKLFIDDEKKNHCSYEGVQLSNLSLKTPTRPPHTVSYTEFSPTVQLRLYPWLSTMKLFDLRPMAPQGHSLSHHGKFHQFFSLNVSHQYLKVRVSTMDLWFNLCCPNFQPTDYSNMFILNIPSQWSANAMEVIVSYFLQFYFLN